MACLTLENIIAIRSHSTFDPTTVETTEGRLFPHVGDMKPLSWMIGSTLEDERADYPKMRAVIRAMMVHRPEQLESERRELLKASFDRMFGHNAKKCLQVIEDEAHAMICPVCSEIGGHSIFCTLEVL